MLRSLWTMVAAHLWQTTLVLALLLSVELLFLGRAPARLSRALWIAGLLKLLLPIGVLVGSLSAERLRAASFVLYPPLAGQASLVEEAPRPRSVAPGDPFLLLTALWLAGASILFARQLGTARRRKSVSVRCDDPRLLDALAETRIPPDRVCVVAGRSIPSVQGLLRPHILVPEALLDRLSTLELRAVLLHEEAHRRRGDIWLGVAESVALTLFYYYPPLWLLRRKLHAAVEMASDEHAISRGIPPETYSSALARTLGICLGPAGSPAIAGRSRSLVARRFQRIAASRRYRIMTRQRIALGLACLVVAAASLLPLSPASGARAEASLGEFEALEVPVMLRFENTALSQVFRALSAACGFEFEFHGADSEVSVDIDGPRNLGEVLGELAERFHVRYQVTAAGVLIVQGPYLAGSDGVTLPRRLSKVNAVYPLEARATRTEGKVVLQAVITPEGQVTDLRVLKAEPEFQGFESAAIDAVGQWRYEPATRDGLPVSTYFTVVVNFSVK